ncbi:MAG: hypothetical protein V1493_01790 [Candidatus Diapherotrites archaeon]
MEIKSKYLMPALFLAFVATYGIFLYITGAFGGPALPLEEAIKDGCVLEYGKNECVEGKLSIPFYNDGTKTIISAEITIPTRNGQDIAGISEQLLPQQTAGAKTTDCASVDGSRPLKLKWCCERCYETEMTNPSDSVTLKKQ